MKIRRVGLENVRSFLDRQELLLPGDISIVIGPNGGGKTNLLDAAVLALRIFLLKSWNTRHNPTADWYERYEWVANDALSAGLLEKHSAAASQPQRIELDIEVTQTDIDNILRTKAESAQLAEKAQARYTSFPGAAAAQWKTDGLVSGQIFTYHIVDGVLRPNESDGAETLKLYLETYEINRRVLEEYDRRPLSMPMISLPVNRSAGTVSTSIALADFSEYDAKRTVDAASSRTSGSITALAIGRLAGRFRDLLERDDGGAKEGFRDDKAMKEFTATLKQLGYDWDLVCTNTRRNQYDIQLTKQGSTFRVGAASSGERELLVYLFAIYALNVRDALIVIDEPELHLHPRWQQTLLGLFERMSRDTGNQFIMATHSPVFVSPASIQYVSRVSAEKQKSRIVRLGESELPERKHLFSIVNSQNNERIFFSDVVVLVEGISDRIFFEALLRHFKTGEGASRVCEVVSVGGKSLFPQYELLLNACRIPYLIIADLDYVREVGTPQVKNLFTVSVQAVKQKVLDDPSSVDGRSLIEQLEHSLKTGETTGLQTLWEYVKARHTRLRPDLDEAEAMQLAKFCRDQRSFGRFILTRGDLEDYLPTGCKRKDLEELIKVVASDSLWDRLPAEGKVELQEIVSAISAAILEVD